MNKVDEMKVTIYDVAKKAGVSIATVSKVINNTGNMRESTRQRVKKVMQELNYHPNVHASALMGKATKTIGFLVQDISNPFFSELAKVIEDRVHEKDFNVFICSTDDDEAKEKKYIELMEHKQVDGFIISSTYKNKDILKNLIKRNVPLVLLTQDDPELNVSKISIDDFKGGYEATAHLLQLGHRNIAIIAEKLSFSSDKRLAGYLSALNTYNVAHNDAFIIRINPSIENGMQALEQLFTLEKAERPTAIFACNEQLAIGVMLAAREKNINIPHELSLVGFDDTILATTTVPRLTTIAQPIKEMGMKTVDLLIEEITTGIRKQERILYNPKLIVRESTAPLK